MVYGLKNVVVSDALQEDNFKKVFKEMITRMNLENDNGKLVLLSSCEEGKEYYGDKQE